MSKKLVMLSVQLKGRRTTKFAYLNPDEDGKFRVSEKDLPALKNVGRGVTYSPAA